MYISMEERKGDPRIYVVIALFFSCLISGGVLLGLYMFLPVNNVKSWYPIAGLFFVCVPWAFWFLTCIYRCIRPDYIRYGAPCKSPLGSPSSRAQATALKSPRNPPLDDDDESKGNSPNGARHVRFGGIVVITDDANNNNGDQDERPCSINQHSDQEDNSVDHSRESVMPLALFVGPPSTS